MNTNIGKIQLTNTVIMDIVLETIKENDAILQVANKNSKVEGINIIKNITKIGIIPDLQVELGETACAVSVGLILKYGENMIEVVKEFQEKLKENIEKMTNIKVNEINVSIVSVKKEMGETNV